MELLRAEEVGYRELFHGVSFSLAAQDKIGLVGKSGSGRSVLLKRLSGERALRDKARRLAESPDVLLRDEVIEATLVLEGTLERFARAAFEHLGVRVLQFHTPQAVTAPGFSTAGDGWWSATRRSYEQALSLVRTRKRRKAKKQ